MFRTLTQVPLERRTAGGAPRAGTSRAGTARTRPGGPSIASTGTADGSSPGTGGARASRATAASPRAAAGAGPRAGAAGGRVPPPVLVPEPELPVCPVPPPVLVPEPEPPPVPVPPPVLVPEPEPPVPAPPPVLVPELEPRQSPNRSRLVPVLPLLVREPEPPVRPGARRYRWRRYRCRRIRRTPTNPENRWSRPEPGRTDPDPPEAAVPAAADDPAVQVPCVPDGNPWDPTADVPGDTSCRAARCLGRVRPPRRAPMAM